MQNAAVGFDSEPFGIEIYIFNIRWKYELPFYNDFLRLPFLSILSNYNELSEKSNKHNLIKEKFNNGNWDWEQLERKQIRQFGKRADRLGVCCRIYVDIVLRYFKEIVIIEYRMRYVTLPACQPHFPDHPLSWSWVPQWIKWWRRLSKEYKVGNWEI